MDVLVHPPITINAPDDWSPVERARLHRVVVRAVEQAAAQVTMPGVAVRVVPIAPTLRTEARTLPQPDAARERVDPSRLGEDAAGDSGYGIPSYQEAGGQVTLPVERVFTTAAGDQIVYAPFQRQLVWWVGPFAHVYAGGGPYITTRNLARAVEWGQNLFGATGFAVLHRVGESSGPYYAAPLERPLTIGDLGGLRETPLERPRQAPGTIVSSDTYRTVTVVTSEGVGLLSARRNAFWSHHSFLAAVSAIPEAERTVPSADVRAAAEGLLSAARTEQGAEGVVAHLVHMDRTLFGAMPWAQRADYLEFLIDAWTGEREETAILEIFYATRSISELEAIAAVLRARGKYGQLFDDLDSQVYELLRHLGTLRSGKQLDWRYLIELLLESQRFAAPSLAAAIEQDPVAELERLAGGVLDWLGGTVEGIEFLLNRPGAVAEGLAHLAELLWIVERARLGDPEAQAFLLRALREGAAGVATALRGLEYAEELGTTYGSRGGGERIGADIIGRLRYALVLEVLSWFVGIGEIRVALRSPQLASRIQALTGALRSLRIVTRAGAAGTRAARLERALGALVGLANLTDHAHAARLLELLPEEYVVRLNRIVESVELPPGAASDALLEALADNPVLLGATIDLGDALAVAGRLEARAGGAGAVTASMTDGLRALLTHVRWDRATLARLVDEVPAAHLDEFMRSLTFVRPEHFGLWGSERFAALAQRPRAMAFLHEAGSDLVELTFRRTGADWAAYDRFLEGVVVRRDQIGNPADYQRFLDRLRNGDAAAYDEVAGALHAQRLAQATEPGQRAAYGLSRLREGNRPSLLEELDEIGQHNVALRDRLAADLAGLADKELDGIEQIARLESGAVDWGDALRTTLTWDAVSRRELLELIADVGPRATDGFEDVLHSIFQRSVRATTPAPEVLAVQGSWGQLYAARTILKRYGAQRLRFEVPGVGRVTDVVAEGGPRRLDVEVKTNLGGTATFDEGEILTDLVTHAPNGYDELLYLYHPSISRQQLDNLGQRMLRLFDGDELRSRFAQRGLNLDAARQALERWLADGRLTTYEF